MSETSGRHPRQVKLIATLGPATDGLEYQLVAAGLDVARLNFSHGNMADHARRCRAVRDAAGALGRQVAILQDLQGPKIRVGRLAGGGPILLTVGQRLDITTREVVGNSERVSCTYQDLPLDVNPGDNLLLDDGRIRLQALEVVGDEVRTRVVEGGPLGENKGINLPGVKVSAPAITQKDRDDLRCGLDELGVDYVALSFIRGAHEVREARELIRAMGHPDVPLVVKLEKGEAVADLDGILDAADAVMVARGDLAVEVSPEKVPLLQKRIIQGANRRGIPVITATQMLESMMQEEIPTRAEATDVANAVWDGTDAVMLSGETAAGRHPLLVVEMMLRIIHEAEAADLPPRAGDVIPHRNPHDREASAITHAARVLAQGLGAAAIACITRSGRTAQLLSMGRAQVPIYGFSPNERTCRQLALWWGVTPVLHPIASDLEKALDDMARFLVQRGYGSTADHAVFTGVHPFKSGLHTNFVKFQSLRPGGE